MITDREKSMLKHLVLSSEWSLLIKVADHILDDIQKRVKLQDTEWDTLKAIIGDEKEAQGIRNFLQIVLKLAKESK